MRVDEDEGADAQTLTWTCTKDKYTDMHTHTPLTYGNSCIILYICIFYIIYSSDRKLLSFTETVSCETRCAFLNNSILISMQLYVGQYIV